MAYAAKVTPARPRGSARQISANPVHCIELSFSDLSPRAHLDELEQIVRPQELPPIVAVGRSVHCDPARTRGHATVTRVRFLARMEFPGVRPPRRTGFATGRRHRNAVLCSLHVRFAARGDSSRRRTI